MAASIRFAGGRAERAADLRAGDGSAEQRDAGAEQGRAQPGADDAENERSHDGFSENKKGGRAARKFPRVDRFLGNDAEQRGTLRDAVVQLARNSDIRVASGVVLPAAADQATHIVTLRRPLTLSNLFLRETFRRREVRRRVPAFALQWRSACRAHSRIWPTRDRGICNRHVELLHRQIVFPLGREGAAPQQMAVRIVLFASENRVGIRDGIIGAPHGEVCFRPAELEFHATEIDAIPCDRN